MNWLDVIRDLSPQQRAVQHQPETPRYSRARSKLRYVLNQGIYLGQRPESWNREAVEIAIWAPPGHGRGPGYYACFRLYLEEEAATFAVLFCFYDGTENSPGFRSADAAREYAIAQGFEKETDGNAD